MKKIEIINLQYLARLFMVFGLLVFANAPAAPKDFALHQAVLDDDRVLVTRLINKGAAIDVIGSRKYGYGSALHLAVREGHPEIAELLLSRGAEVDVLDPDDFTPLHNAAWNGNLEMTELLLEAGADINAVTYDGDTPLSLAQNNDQTQVAGFIQARLQASSVVDTKVESVPVSDPGVIDISGTYIADVTGDTKRFFYRNEGTKYIVKIVQSGNKITGSFGDSAEEQNVGEFWGELEGNSINFTLHITGGTSGVGKWTVDRESNEITGIWIANNPWYEEGTWNLTKIEPVDFTGTYIADISGGSGLLSRLLFRPYSTDVRKVIITQSGSQITGTYDDGKGKIYGDIKGDTIEFYWTSHDQLHGGGKWTHVPESNELVGRFESMGGGITLGSGEWNLTKVEPVDITGTYVSEMTGKIDDRYRKITLSQSGNIVTGTWGDNPGNIFTGTRDGDIIVYNLIEYGAGYEKEGKWRIMEGGRRIEGSWRRSDDKYGGKWDLTKVESEPIVDISGTYSAEITHKNLPIGVKPKDSFGRQSNIEVEITQNGNAITGSMSGDRSGSITGVIEGKEITFEWEMPRETGYYGGSTTYGKGKWTISDDHNIFNGTWTNYSSHPADGEWNLTKVE